MPSSRFYPIEDDAYIVIPYIHKKIHEGEVYRWHYENLSAASGPSTYIHIKTGANDVHSEEEFMAMGGIVQIQWFAAPTVGTAGTAIACINRNRNYAANSPLTTIDANPTVTTVGTVLFGARTILASSTSQAKATTAIAEGAERVLVKNSDYLVRITCSATALSVVADGLFYEED